MDLRDIQVVYEDNHLIAVNKPGGWLVQGDQTGDTPISEYVKHYIKVRYNKPGDVFLGVIHRIDRPTTGLVIFARTSKALTRMNELFKNRKVEKTYWAITSERPEPLEGILVDYLVKDKTKNVTKAFDRVSNRNPDAKRSELAYKLIGQIATHHLLEVKPETGRSHQIRVQLAKRGWIIQGDKKYGATGKNKSGVIRLHSRSLRFIHPVKKEPVFIKADMPKKDQIWQLFSELQEEINAKDAH